MCYLDTEEVKRKIEEYFANTSEEQIKEDLYLSGYEEYKDVESHFIISNLE